MSEFEMREVTCSKCGKLCDANVPVSAFYEYVCWDYCNREVLEKQVWPLDEIEIIRSRGYKIRITVEATAPCAISGASAEGETVEEAVTKLGVKLESIARSKQDASPPLPSV